MSTLNATDFIHHFKRKAKAFKQSVDAEYGGIDGLLKHLLDADQCERLNKQRVYQTIAAFIHKQSGCTPAVCLAATYRLCQETDAELYAECRVTDDEVQTLAASAMQYILAIKVRYELDEAEHYICQVKIYHLSSDNEATLTCIGEQIQYEDLPEEVRGYFLQNGQHKINITLFPQDEEVS